MRWRLSGFGARSFTLPLYMPYQLSRSPKVDHRPLHSVAELALTLPRVQRVLLPAELSKPAGPWVTAATTGLVALIAGWQLLQIPEFQATPAKWAVIGMTGLFAGAAIWWTDRQRLSKEYWLVDFAQGRILPVGRSDRESIVIDPNEHSLGCYVAGGSRSTPSYALELRHVRRGPVAQLSNVPLTGSGQRFESEREQLDLCVDLLAQRLRIRRSGEPLVKAGHRRPAF